MEKVVAEQKTYSSITPLIEDINTALGRERLRTGHDTLGAVHHAPPAGPLHVLVRRGREHRGRGERHLELFASSGHAYMLQNRTAGRVKRSTMRVRPQEYKENRSSHTRKVPYHERPRGTGAGYRHDDSAHSRSYPSSAAPYPPPPYPHAFYVLSSGQPSRGEPGLPTPDWSLRFGGLQCDTCICCINHALRPSSLGKGEVRIWGRTTAAVAKQEDGATVCGLKRYHCLKQELHKHSSSH